MTLLHFSQLLSKWLRIGLRTQHQVFLHAWSKILYHNEWTIFFHWTNYTTTGLNNQIIHSLPKYFLSTSFIKHYSRSCLGHKEETLPFNNWKSLGSIAIQEWFWRKKKLPLHRRSHKNNKIQQKYIHICLIKIWIKPKLHLLEWMAWKSLSLTGNINRVSGWPRRSFLIAGKGDTQHIYDYYIHDIHELSYKCAQKKRFNVFSVYAYIPH